MKHRRRLLSLAFICTTVFALAWWLLHDPGPWYHGKSLRYWTSQLGEWDLQERAAAREALQAIGQPAVPPLLKTLEKHESPFKLKVLSYAPRFPFLNRLFSKSLDGQRAEAAAALGEIGPPASNAIPALIAAGKVNDTVQPHAMAALMKIRGEPVDSLINTLQPDIANEHAFSRTEAWRKTVSIIGKFGPDAHALVPELCRTLAGAQEPIIASASAQALGRIHAQPEVAVPALILALTQRGDCTFNTLWSLGEFGSDARTAAPEIRKHLGAIPPQFRFIALRSLCRILPPDQLKPDEIKELVPMLEPRLKDPDPHVRSDAANLLVKINPAPTHSH